MLQADRASTTAPASIELTKKGERYLAEHVLPIPRRALRRLARLRREAEAEIERLLALLDQLDGDADLEPSLAAPESIPPAGSTWLNPRGRQLRWATGNRDDLEGDAHEDDEDIGDDEPSLGSYNVIPGRSMVDGCASWPEQTQAIDAGMDQRGWIGLDDNDLEGEHDGREDGADTEPNGDELDDRGDNGIGDLDGLSWAQGGMVPASF